MAYICVRKQCGLLSSCKECQHYRKDPDEDRYSCFAIKDIEEKGMSIEDMWNDRMSDVLFLEKELCKDKKYNYRNNLKKFKQFFSCPVKIHIADEVDGYFNVDSNHPGLSDDDFEKICTFVLNCYKKSTLSINILVSALFRLYDSGDISLKDIWEKPGTVEYKVYDRCNLDSEE